jgi:hypothetical protein
MSTVKTGNGGQSSHYTTDEDTTGGLGNALGVDPLAGAVPNT